jgi:hypothetical protein
MSHIQFTRRLGAFMAFIGFALTIIIGGWSLGALLAFGLFIGALIYLVNRVPLSSGSPTASLRRIGATRPRAGSGSSRSTTRATGLPGTRESTF